MTQRKHFVVGEWYHCYNRGIENRVVFEDVRDYHRFIELLYLANDTSPLRHGDLGIHKFEEILTIPRGKKLVAIGAFSLMPNHFNVVLKEVTEGGITAFMRKVGTAYTMYFNARYGRKGNLFLGPFQSLHAPAERDFQHLISYVHCNPAELYEQDWKTVHPADPQFLEEQIAVYLYSSLGAYTGTRAPFRAILDAEALSIPHAGRIQKMLQEARRYSADSGLS